MIVIIIISKVSINSFSNNALIFDFSVCGNFVKFPSFFNNSYCNSYSTQALVQIKYFVNRCQNTDEMFSTKKRISIKRIIFTY